MSVTLSLDDHLEGFETLKISEKIKIFFSEISVGIDNFNANVFNNSIHTVNGEGVLKILKKQNDYYTFASNQIPTPIFFNPKKCSFREYVSFCISSIGLISVTTTEVERLYNIFKKIVNDGKVPFSIREWNHQTAINTVKEKMDLYFETETKATLPINQVYSSVTDAEELFKYYNSVVRNLKSRDLEILNKKINLLIDIFKLIRKKMDVHDLNFEQNDITSMELAIERLSELVSIGGLLTGRLNELCRCLELQVDEFRRYLKK